MFYMGKEFNKAENKEYKTLEGGLKAAQKNRMNLYDENGETVSENVPKAQLTNDGSATPEEVQTEEDGVTEVKGKIKRVFKGKLRIRRSASWDDEAVCGITMFDEKKVVRRHVVSGKAIFETVDGYFISGKPDHVEFIAE